VDLVMSRKWRKNVGDSRRVGIFGVLGAGNIGNDASMEAVLHYLRTHHPAAVVDTMCAGPIEVNERYGIPAISMFWFDRYKSRISGPPATILKLASRIFDVFRIGSWVRGHDVVIVPGAGVLEASLPLRPWDTPYALLLVSASGRVFGSRVAYVSVGVGAIQQRVTRWLSNSAARLASYRSYRDSGSREEMSARGIDTSNDCVYPDLAFALPLPADYRVGLADWSAVGLGIMAYRGSNDDRHHGEEIYARYLHDMKEVVGWLIDNGRRVRLLIGDTNGSDEATAAEILADVHDSRPHLDRSWLGVEPVSTFKELMEAMEPLGAVIATRYHNLIAAIKLSKPTIAISYSPKHDALMSDMGLAEFRQSVSTLDIDGLGRQFLEMEARADQLQDALLACNASTTQLVERMFEQLDDVLFDTPVTPGLESAESLAQERI
jgi:polysaccharide pyruvyl transferase WcaK-like protein